MSLRTLRTRAPLATSLLIPGSYGRQVVRNPVRTTAHQVYRLTIFRVLYT
jgi:hypothetical protein